MYQIILLRYLIRRESEAKMVQFDRGDDRIRNEIGRMNDLRTFGHWGRMDERRPLSRVNKEGGLSGGRAEARSKNGGIDGAKYSVR